MVFLCDEESNFRFSCVIVEALACWEHVMLM